jgi:hypothetical protein
MKFHRLFLLISLTALLLLTLGWNAWLYTIPDKSTQWHFLYNAMYGCLFFLGGITAIFNAKSFGFGANIGKMLLFMGLGLLSFWGGNIIWLYYTFFLQTPIPYPSLADVAYGLMYPCLTVGVIYLLKIYQNLVTKSVIRDSLIILFASFLVIFGFFARPDISSELPLIQRIINVYYPFGNVVVLSIALIALRVGGGKIHPSIYIFAFGLVFQTVGDLLFSYRTATEVYWNGDISDLFYTIAAYVMSIGIIEIIHNLKQDTVAIIQPDPLQSSDTKQPIPVQQPSIAPSQSSIPQQSGIPTSEKAN